MKKIYCLLAIAAVVATAACSKDDNNSGMSEEALLTGQATDWFKSGLLGQPKKMVRNYYSEVQLDSTTNRAITPDVAQLESVGTTKFSGAGFKTVEEATQKTVVGAEKIPNNPHYVRVSTKQLPVGKYTYTYDSKNRLTLTEAVAYYNSSEWGDYNLYGTGDSSFVYNATEGSFKFKVDSSSRYKTETTYSETTATVIDYRMDTNGKWVEYGSKFVYTLNKYGFIDNKSTYEIYSIKPSAFEDKPGTIDYKEVDDRGNLKLTYSILTGYKGNYISSYITYTYEY